MLKNHTTKRILVDAPQWEAFFQADPLPKEVLSQLHWPFDNAIYLEPTHPIMPADMDVVDHALKESINAQGEDVDDGEKSYIRAMVILPTGERRTLCILNSWKGQMMSATCELNLQQGTAHGEPPPGFTPQQGAESFQDSLNYFATAVTLLIAYITAKGIIVTPEPLPRQQRRRLEQTGQPNPWYVIRAQDTRNQTASASDGTSWPTAPTGPDTNG